MNEQFYILFNNNGEFLGFYNDLNVVSEVASRNHNNMYCKLSPEMYKKIYSKLPYVRICVDKIHNEETVIDFEEYITDIEPNIDEINESDFEQYKLKLIQTIKTKCGMYIAEGTNVTLQNGEIKKFSFNIEDQINLREILENYTSSDKLYYHADGELDTLYLYQDIQLIHKALYNNKLYNKIYSDVLCKWINDNFTLDFYLSKTAIVDYGFKNSQIMEEVIGRYEKQKLS